MGNACARELRRRPLIQCLQLLFLAGFVNQYDRTLDERGEFGDN